MSKKRENIEYEEKSIKNQQWIKTDSYRGKRCELSHWISAFDARSNFFFFNESCKCNLIAAVLMYKCVCASSIRYPNVIWPLINSACDIGKVDFLMVFFVRHPFGRRFLWYTINFNRAHSGRGWIRVCLWEWKCIHVRFINSVCKKHQISYCIRLIRKLNGRRMLIT